MQSTGLMLFWLLIVLALIPVSLWLLKRSGVAGVSGDASAAVLKPVAQVSLGNGQRVVTVEINSGEQRTWLVLGVTAQQINTLHTLPAPAVSPAPVGLARPLPPFAQLLRRATERPGDAQAPRDPQA